MRVALARVAVGKPHAAKAAQVQIRIKALDKIELPKKQTVVKFDLRTPARSGDQVAVLQDVHKSYGSWVICDEFSLSIRRQERWAVMGRNGGRQIHTSENNCGSRKARHRSVSARRQFDYGLLRPTISGCTRSQPDGNPAEGTSHRTASAHCEYSAALLSFQTTMSTNLSALFPVASARV